MSDDSQQETSLDARKRADVKRITRKLVEMGMNPEDAKAQAEATSDRLAYAGKGPVRVLKPFSQGEFYPGSFDDPLAPLVTEIFYGAPDEQKLVATEQRRNEYEAIVDAKVRSGEYHRL